MKPRLINLEAMRKALRPYLEDYLQEHGIDTSKNFSCLNPQHPDDNPSMTCRQFNERAYCFGCNFSCDIIQAACILEGKPEKGIGFIEDNIMYLAKKYNVNVQMEDLTAEEIYEYRTYQAYDFAAQLVADPSFGDYTKVNEEIERRGWDPQKLVDWGIGTVNNDEFKARLRQAGFEPGFLSGVDLERSNLFANHNLLFTVYDDEGRPVGFSAKNLKHNKNDKFSGPKYINTSGTGLRCAIFKKGERLYGYEIAKEAPDPLYIFEGQADVITARHYGLMNCCCTMGTSITDHHIDLLKKHGSFNVVLVFDADPAGEIAIQNVLDQRFSREKDFRVKLCQLPAGQDPDELLRTQGFDAFVRLKRWTAFEWRMTQFSSEGNEELEEDKRRDIAEKMAPIIVAEKSYIRQEEMAKQVSKMTGYDITTILSEVKRLKNEKDADIQARKINLIESLASEARRNPRDAELALAQCQTAINDINKTMKSESEASATLGSIMALKDVDEAKTGDFAGYYLKPDGLGIIGSHLDDDWKQDNLIFVGGSQQAGKTTFCCQMAYEIADDPMNNAICIYHSIDDSMKAIVYKWICNASRSLNLWLGHVANPNYWATQEGYEYVKDLREKAYRKILKMVKNNQLIVKDSSDGSSLAYAESIINYYRELYPEKNIVLFIDNFHKLPDYADRHGHERVKMLSNHVKNMTVRHHITVIATAEYKKLGAGEVPDNMALAESRSLAYDANVIFHLYNDLHHKGENESMLIHYDEQGRAWPRIRCRFGKNKVSGFEGREFLDLYPGAARYVPVPLEQAIQDMNERKAFLDENKSRVKY
jgi:DNA primase catalytic core